MAAPPGKTAAPAGKNRQTGPARRGRRAVCNRRAGRPAAPETAPKTAREKPMGSRRKTWPGQPAAGRARHRQRPVQGRGKNKNGRRGPAAGRKQKCSSRGGNGVREPARAPGAIHHRQTGRAGHRQREERSRSPRTGGLLRSPPAPAGGQNARPGVKLGRSGQHEARLQVIGKLRSRPEFRSCARAPSNPS